MREVALGVRMFVLGAGLLGSGIGGSRAADPDPLWDRAVATVALAGRSVASRIETRADVYDGDGKRMETHQRIETLTGWNGQDPVRESEVKRDVVKKSGLSVTIGLGARDNPFAATLDGRVSREPAGADTLDGCRFATYRFEELPAPGNQEEIGVLIGTAWIDRDTGIPLKVAYRPKELPKHVSVYDLTVRFRQQPDRSTVPTELDMQMKAGFLWYKRVVHLHKEFFDWVTAPDPVANDSLPQLAPAGAP